MDFRLPKNKTKIVCTIGRTSSSEAVLEKLILSGMSVARLNFAHATPEEHRTTIKRIRRVAKRLNRTLPILADLPGPKIRIGKLEHDPILLKGGDRITLTTEKVLGTQRVIHCTYKNLPKSVSKGSKIFVNDGFIQLKVIKKDTKSVVCEVIIGGYLHSHKGVNLPRTHISATAVSKNDLDLLKFGLKAGVDAFSVSFVKSASDIQRVRTFAKSLGKQTYVVAKIEREIAVKNSQEILQAADALMVARGDLGVEIPIERVPLIQKQLIQQANLLGKPVITATQMLESMTANIRPTRAEVTDVANAILDGTDAIMLSAETATGIYPVETVKMMAQIACATEQDPQATDVARTRRFSWQRSFADQQKSIKDVIALDVAETVSRLNVRYVLTPTQRGDTPRRIASFKPPCWVLAYAVNESVKNFLNFSWGVYPFLVKRPSGGWDKPIINQTRKLGLAKTNDRILITERLPIGKHMGTNSLKVITLD